MASVLLFLYNYYLRSFQILRRKNSPMSGKVNLLLKSGFKVLGGQIEMRFEIAGVHFASPVHKFGRIRHYN